MPNVIHSATISALFALKLQAYGSREWTFEMIEWIEMTANYFASPVCLFFLMSCCCCCCCCACFIIIICGLAASVQLTFNRHKSAEMPSFQSRFASKNFFSFLFRAEFFFRKIVLCPIFRTWHQLSQRTGNYLLMRTFFCRDKNILCFFVQVDIKFHMKGEKYALSYAVSTWLQNKLSLCHTWAKIFQFTAIV